MATDHAEVLETTLKRELSAVTDHVEASVTTQREDHSEATDQEEASERIQRENLSAVKEEVSTLEERASTERTSAISVTKRRAESTR